MRILVTLLIVSSSMVLSIPPRAKAEDRYAVCSNECLVRLWDLWCARPKRNDPEFGVGRPCTTVLQSQLQSYNETCTTVCKQICDLHDPCWDKLPQTLTR
jgi:hypothetical protein